METQAGTRLYTVKQAAVRLMVSPALMYALVAAHRIRHERHGLRRGKILIPEDALEEYRRRCTVEVGAPAPQEVPVSEPKRKEHGIDLW